MTTRARRAGERVPYYPPAPAPSGTGLVDALFSELERQRLEAATDAIAEELEALRQMEPALATGAPSAVLVTLTDELGRLPAGAWARRTLKQGAVVALRRDPDGRRRLRIIVPASLARPDVRDGWVRAVCGWCLWSGAIWEDVPRDPAAPLFEFTEQEAP